MQKLPQIKFLGEVSPVHKHIYVSYTYRKYKIYYTSLSGNLQLLLLTSIHYHWLAIVEFGMCHSFPMAEFDVKCINCHQISIQTAGAN